MAFADAVKQTRYICGFAISLGVYDPATDTTYEAKLATHPQFGDGRDVVILDASSISCAMRFEDGIGEVSDFTFTIANRRLASLAPNITAQKLTDLFASGYTCEGQSVHVSMLIVDKDESVRVRELWRGKIIEVEYSDEQIRFHAIHQTMDALKQTIGREITLSEYDDALPGSIGCVKPIVFGDWMDEPEDVSGWTEDFYHAAQMAGAFGSDRLIPCHCIEQNRVDVTQGPKFLIANHELQQASSTKVYLLYAAEQCGMLVFPVTQLTSGTPSTYQMDDEPQFIQCVDSTHIIYNDGWNNPHRAVDNEIDYYADAIGESAELRIGIRPPAAYGRFIAARLAVVRNCYSPTSGNTITYGLWDEDNSAWVGSPLTEYIPTATSGREAFSFDLVLDDYDDIPNNVSIRVVLSSPSEPQTWVFLHLIGLAITGANRQIALDPVTRMPVAKGPEPEEAKKESPEFHRSSIKATGKNYMNIDPSAFRVYARCKGVADNAAGLFTGTSGALIETPASIIYWLCNEIGLAARSSPPGKVTDARADQQADNLKAALVIAEKASVTDLISELCRASLLALTIDPSGTTFGLVYRRSAPETNLYSDPIRFEYVVDAWIGWTSLDEIANAIYVHCEYAPPKGKTTALCYCDGTGSDDGYGVDDYTEKTKLATSISRYDRREFHIQAKTLRRSSATVVRNSLADYLYERRVRLVITTTWRYFDLKPGHVIRLHNDSWLAAGYKYPGSTGGQDGYWEYGGETRYFWVERITWTPDGLMEIEATERV